MAKILLGDKDPLFATAFEDHLHVVGHQVSVEPNVGRIVRTAAAQQADLVVLSLALPSMAGVEGVRALRRLPEIRSLPILVLSEAANNKGRVSILRAGADDLVTKTCGLEEILLRVERLLGSREAGLRLQGDFRDQPPWEMVQCVQQVGKSGELIVRSRTGSGKIRIEGGEVNGATWGRQQQREALLAILSLKEGRFQFLADPEAVLLNAENKTRSLPVHHVLMEAAWLQDETEKRRASLPPTGAPLQVKGGATANMGAGFEGIPAEWVLGRLRERPGLRLFDLVAESDEAPPKVRLAVALLAERGAIEAQPRPGGEGLMSTMEITSSLLFNVVLDDLHETLQKAGFTDSTLRLVLLAETGVWPELTELLAKAQESDGDRPLRKLAGRMATGKGGMAGLQTKLGQLVLHVQPLTSEGEAGVDAVIPRCAGVLVWLDKVEEPRVLRIVIGRLATAVEGARGVMLAGEERAREKVSEFLRDTARWQLSPHPPKSLLGVFRLFHPRQRR